MLCIVSSDKRLWSGVATEVPVIRLIGAVTGCQTRDATHELASRLPWTRILNAGPTFGFTLNSRPRKPFFLQFFLLTILFIIFDIEIALILILPVICLWSIKIVMLLWCPFCSVRLTTQIFVLLTIGRARGTTNLSSSVIADSAAVINTLTYTLCDLFLPIPTLSVIGQRYLLSRYSPIIEWALSKCGLGWSAF